MLTEDLVDFHCHLDLFPNHGALIEACEARRIKALTVTNAPAAWRGNQDLARGCQHVRVALGLHPQLAAERRGELGIFERYLSETRYVGEVGLDGSPGFAPSLRDQQDVFRRILDLCAEDGRKILTVHSRDAAGMVLDEIETRLPPGRGAIVLHWFNGTLEEARRALSLGTYFSVNARMLDSERGRKLVSMLPAERILTESDGPFIQRNGRPTSPLDTGVVIRRLGGCWGLPDVEVLGVVRRTLRTLVS